VNLYSSRVGVGMRFALNVQYESDWFDYNNEYRSSIRIQRGSFEIQHKHFQKIALAQRTVIFSSNIYVRPSASVCKALRYIERIFVASMLHSLRSRIRICIFFLLLGKSMIIAQIFYSQQWILSNLVLYNLFFFSSSFYVLYILHYFF